MKSKIHFFGIVALLISLIKPTLVLAESGLPNSAEFGYGVRLDLNGNQINSSISAAASLKINWLAIDFDWTNLWPNKDVNPNLDALIQAMYLAQQNHLNVMISITRPPAWVITPDGPNVEMTVKVLNYLANTFPDILLAIELFPGANTVQGWGTTPNPKAYFNLLKKATQSLKASESKVTLVAAGLMPLSTDHPASDMNDLDFLQALYNAGAKPFMPIVGIQLLETTGDPMLTPSQSENRCLRHFEAVRQVMINHDHRMGLIWLTGFSWPAGDIQASDSIYKNTNEQTQWLSQAYQILKAQLYLGVAFFSQINPPGSQTFLSSPASLIHPDLSFHPALSYLSLLISPPADNTKLSIQTVLVKRIVQDIQFKPLAGNTAFGQ